MVGEPQAFYRADMKKSANLLGCALLFLGAIWAFQGIGVVGGSFMTGRRLWLVIGIVLVVLGVLVASGGLFRRGPGR